LQGETALYDTLIDGLLMVKHGRYPRKALFLITDGFDNRSESKKEKVAEVAKQLNVAIYSIGIGRPGVSTGWFRREMTAVDMETLGELASTTRARTYNVPVSSGGDELKQGAAAIAEAISNRYAIGFVAPGTSSNSLRLELRNHPGVSLQIEGAPISAVNVADTPVKN
jgi:von Willebrand factor type A domain